MGRACVCVCVCVCVFKEPLQRDCIFSHLGTISWLVRGSFVGPAYRGRFGSHLSALMRALWVAEVGGSKKAQTRLCVALGNWPNQTDPKTDLNSPVPREKSLRAFGRDSFSRFPGKTFLQGCVNHELHIEN